MHREPRSSHRASARPAPAQRRPAGPSMSADDVLHLQRTVGNRAANHAIQRSLPGGEILEKGGKALKKIDEGYEKVDRPIDKIGQVAAPGSSAAAAAGVAITSLGSNPADPNSYLQNLGNNVTLDSSAVTVGFDGFAFIRESKAALEAYGEHLKASESGDEIRKKTAWRQLRIKVADWASDTAKAAGGDASQVMGVVMGAGAAVGTAGAGVGGALVALVRSSLKFRKKNFQVDNLTDLLTDPSIPADKEEAVSRQREIDLRIYELGNSIGEEQSIISGAEFAVSVFEELSFPEAAEARAELDTARRNLSEHQAELQRSVESKGRIDETARIVAAKVKDFNAEVERLVLGEKPSMEALRYYAQAKSLRGWMRRLVQVAADTIGLGGALMALIAATVAATAVTGGLAGAVLTGIAAFIGLGIVGWKSWNFLAHRWGLLDNAYTLSEEKDENGAAKYEEIDTFGKKFKAFARNKEIFGKLDNQDYVKKNKGSVRTMAAETLWEYATDEKYEQKVHDEAWSLIETLTQGKKLLGGVKEGISREQLVKNGGNSEQEKREYQEALAKQKAETIKLLEDKLKSA